MKKRQHLRTCSLCEAMCGIEVDVEGEAVVKIQGDELDPFSRGYHCIKGEALADLHADPKRLKHPLRKKGNDWEEIPWDVALDEVADNLLRVQAAHGKDSVASYIGNPNAHHYGSLLYLQGFLRQLRTRNRYAATSVDQLPHHMVGYFMLGHQLLLPVPDIDRTDFLLILGGNPLVSRGSMMTAPDVTNRLKAIKEKGGEVVLVDPRKTETAAVATRHHYIRPGTDAALLLGLLHVVHAEGLAKPGRLAAFTDGFDRIAEIARAYPPERVADVTGIAAAEIQGLARRFAAAKAAVCYGRVGVSTQEFGSICQWLLTALNVVTGNFDRPGGAMFTTPAFDPLPYVSRGHFGRWKSRVRGLPEFAGELPVAVLAEEMATPGPGQIRALVTTAGNPVLSTPGGDALGRALPRLDYMASIDFYVNETTRHAQHILPPTAALEHEHYDAVFHVLAVRNTTRFSEPCFTPADGTRHDWEILAGLEKRLRRGKGGHLQKFLTPERILALGLRFGPHGQGLNPFSKGLTLARVKRHPRGIDLGPLEPRLPGRLFNETKRIQLAPEPFTKDLERLERRLFAPRPSTGELDLLLIGRRQVRVNNSWMGHFDRLTKGRPTCTALMHPSDAERRGIKTGEDVRVRSKAGEIVLPVVVVDGIMPGVVSIPHGFAPGRGVSVNDVTDPGEVDQVSGNAILNGVPISVEKIQ